MKDLFFKDQFLEHSSCQKPPLCATISLLKIVYPRLVNYELQKRIIIDMAISIKQSEHIGVSRKLLDELIVQVSFSKPILHIIKQIESREGVAWPIT